jgi:hypothetical protein
LLFAYCSAALSRNRRTGFLKLPLSPGLSSRHLLIHAHLFPLLLIFLAYLRKGRDAQLGFIPRSSSASLQQFFHSHRICTSYSFKSPCLAFPWTSTSTSSSQGKCRRYLDLLQAV